MKTLPVFEGILEQEFAKRILVEHVRAARIGHAYLFIGPPGVGKKLMALGFAAAALCGSQGCGECPDCQRALSAQHPDLLLLEEEDKTIKVGRVRQLGQEIIIGPHSGKFRFFIIDEAHKMTEQAQNALLKILEEPPAYACLILIVDDASKVLPTVQSRCVPVRFGPLAIEIVERELSQRGVPVELARTASLLSRGSLGRALQLAQEAELTQVGQAVSAIVSSVVKGDQYQLLQMAQTIAQQQIAAQVLDYLELVWRDAVMAKVGAALVTDIGATVIPLALTRLQRGCRMITESRAALNRYQNTRLVLETLLLTL